MVKVSSNKKRTGGKTKREGLIPWKQRKSHQRVPCETVTEDNSVEGKTETERWGWKEGGPGREKSTTVAFRQTSLPVEITWVHLERQIQKPSPSDSGSFGLAQGSGPVGSRSKETLGKLPSE